MPRKSKKVTKDLSNEVAEEFPRTYTVLEPDLVERLKQMNPDDLDGLLIELGSLSDEELTELKERLNGADSPA